MCCPQRPICRLHTSFMPQALAGRKDSEPSNVNSAQIYTIQTMSDCLARLLMFRKPSLEGRLHAPPSYSDVLMWRFMATSGPDDARVPHGSPATGQKGGVAPETQELRAFRQPP